MAYGWRTVCAAATVLFCAADGWASDFGDCNPDALNQALAACGMDIGCMNRAAADFNAACLGQPQPPPPSTPTPTPSVEGGNIDQRLADCGFDLACMNRVMQEALGEAIPSSPSPSPPPQAQSPGMDMGGGMGQRLESCGNDPSCIQQLMGDMQNQPGGNESEFDTTKRLGENTILSPSWLQTYQEALVACRNNDGCWGREMAAANGHLQSRCGTNLMIEATVICQIAARYELHIEQAIAQQRLWRKGIRFDGATPGATPVGGTPGTVSMPTATPNPTIDTAEAASRLFDFLPDIPEGRVRQILARWESTLERSIPRAGRDRIAMAADAYPLESDGALPPLIYEESEAADGTIVDAKPTRRDWAYSLTGFLLTHAGFAEGGTRGRTLLDSAFWSVIQAAKLKLEGSHLVSVGFHLNLKGRVEEARDVLIYARKISPEQPDTDNNLAFSYSALGREEEAKALQQNAARLDPGDAHVVSRLHAMLGGAEVTPASSAMPYGGDFGEAFFRLGKRHTLREYWAGKEWFESRERAKGQAFGAHPPVAGPYEWYVEQNKDIDAAYAACSANAPEELRGCPFGAFIYHPSCEGAASPEEVARSRHNRNVKLCECSANAIMARANALSAYLDRSIAVWTAHEKAWWPRLDRYVRSWSGDIKNVNARYTDHAFEFPLEAAYWTWPDEFREDSEDAWDSQIPGIAAKWHDLKTQAQNLKTCGTRLPPIPKVPKKPPSEPERTVKEYGVNLFVVSFALRMDGNFKFNFDLGFIKGGYERVAGRNGHRFEVGSGPVEFSYQTNAAPGPGGDSTRVTMSASANFFEFVPGAGRAGAVILDQFVSFGGKYEVGWGSRNGFSGNATVEAQSKVGFTTANVPVPRGTRLLN